MPLHPLHPFAKIAAGVGLLVVSMAIFVNMRFGIQADYVSYWAAAKLTLAGNPAGAYDLALHKKVELSAVKLDGLLPFPYPPPYLLAILPFGLLPYAVAHAAWVSTTLAACVASAKSLLPDSTTWVLAFPPIIICGIIGQNSFLLAAIFMTALALLKPHPFVAGVVFGCMIFKPHLGVLLPLALLAGSEWRAFMGATVSTLALSLLSLMLFGMASWNGFFALLPLYGNIAADGLVSWNKMASVYAALCLVGVPEMMAWIIHISLALTACMVVWRVWRMSRDTLTRGTALVAATLMISPYLYIYDQMLLVIGVLYLRQESNQAKWLGLVYAMSIISLAGNFYPPTLINFAPLVTIVMLFRVMQLSARTDERLHQHDQQIAQSYQ